MNNSLNNALKSLPIAEKKRLASIRFRQRMLDLRSNGLTYIQITKKINYAVSRTYGTKLSETHIRTIIKGTNDNSLS